MPATLRRYWIAVASADHARRGRDEMQPGFMQVCHGKQAPLKRLQGGDWVVYYAPTITMGGKDKCQSFISLGVVRAGEPYAFDMGGFVPFRRDVDYLAAQETPIAPLLPHLAFIDNPKNWGYKFRFGLFAISQADMCLIAHAMGVDLQSLPAFASQAQPVPAPSPVQAVLEFD